MRSALMILAAIGTSTVASSSHSPFTRAAGVSQAPRPLGITNVTVIDVERGARLRDHTIIIEGGRISTVGPSSQVRVPDGYGVIPARGKFVIPGFVDRHAHLTSVEDDSMVVVEGAATRLARFALHGTSTMAERSPSILESLSAVRRDAGNPPIPRVHVDAGVDRGGSVPADSTRHVPDGMVVHEELRRAVEGGLTPAAALEALTVDAARALRWQNRVGSIARGRFADLIILDANPLEDIRNTTQINAVLIGGRFIDSAERQRLLAGLAPR
ncbi:MAG TPA: amidohydrolase family protein [Gemmatimonadaceae bacterium]|nr:amidohydrolase family protein [Gemmatimonadaceae bacterium]